MREVSGYHCYSGTPRYNRAMNLTPADLARFWSKVDSSGGPKACWPWMGPRHGAPGSSIEKQYGQVAIARRKYSVTKVMLYIAGSQLAIKRGEYILHSCDNPPCVNPTHLRLGSQSENQFESVSKGRHCNAAKTHCKNGHEFTEENTYYPPRKNRAPERVCITCTKKGGA